MDMHEEIYASGSECNLNFGGLASDAWDCLATQICNATEAVDMDFGADFVQLVSFHPRFSRPIGTAMSISTLSNVIAVLKPHARCLLHHALSDIYNYILWVLEFGVYTHVCARN